MDPSSSPYEYNFEDSSLVPSRNIITIKSSSNENPQEEKDLKIVSIAEVESPFVNPQLTIHIESY